MHWFEYIRREMRRLYRCNPVLTIASWILVLLAVVFLTPLIAEFALALILILLVAMAVYWVVEKWGFIK